MRATRHAQMPSSWNRIMKKLLPAFIILIVLNAPAFAGPCVALDYQEMKDMSINELVKETCSAEANNDGNDRQVLANLDATRVAKPFPNAEQNREQCAGQIDRMLRILKSRGISEKLYKLCKQQAAGQIITATPDVKWSPSCCAEWAPLLEWRRVCSPGRRRGARLAAGRPRICRRRPYLKH